jgi:hypothetical protein
LVLVQVAAIVSSSCDPDLLRGIEKAMAAESETVGRRRATTMARQAAGA